MAENTFWHGSSGAIFKVGRRILYMITTSEPLAQATPRPVAQTARCGGVVPIVA
jgi:hypothetical protein